MANDWVLTYAHDQSGNPISGSILALRDAILKGADVKVLYSTTPDFTWSRLCPHVAVKNIEGRSLISATVMEIADTQQQSFGLDFATKPFVLEYHIYNTSGVRIMMKFDYTTHQFIEREQTNPAIRWFTTS